MAEEWISISQAAAQLGVERSSLTRYVDKWNLEKRRHGRVALVELNGLRAHRAENVHLDAAPVSAFKTASGASKPTLTGSQRKANADAELREMELAERRGQLTPTDEVDRAVRSAVAMMAAAYDKQIEGTAADASLRYGWDERTVRLVLKQFRKGGMGVFHKEMMAVVERQAALTDGDKAFGQSIDLVLQ